MVCAGEAATALRSRRCTHGVVAKMHKRPHAAFIAGTMLRLPVRHLHEGFRDEK